MHRFLQGSFCPYANCVAVYWRISCPKLYRTVGGVVSDPTGCGVSGARVSRS